MGVFLLNDLGEVLLEISSGLNMNKDLCLEVNEQEHNAILKDKEQSIKIDYIHEELMLPLKQNRYLFVIERNNQFYAKNSTLAKVIFIN